MFFDYSRDFPLISRRFSDPTANTTIFLPTNHAILSLNRQPHQAPEVISKKFNYFHSAREEEDFARSFLSSWVSLHIVPRSVDIELEEEVETMLKGRKVWIKQDNRDRTKRVVMDGENQVEIVDIIEVSLARGWLFPLTNLFVSCIIQASNGRIILIEGTFSLQ